MLNNIELDGIIAYVFKTYRNSLAVCDVFTV